MESHDIKDTTLLLKFDELKESTMGGILLVYV